jgi:hypothetical protein
MASGNLFFQHNFFPTTKITQLYRDATFMMTLQSCWSKLSLCGFDEAGFCFAKAQDMQY